MTTLKTNNCSQATWSELFSCSPSNLRHLGRLLGHNSSYLKPCKYMIFKEKQRCSSVSGCLDMVGVASSNLVAPTKFGRIKKIPNTKPIVLGFFLPFPFVSA
jgi:hypothetical protein